MVSSASVSSSTTLVNVSDDAEIRLIQVLIESIPVTDASILEFHDQCKKYIAEGNVIGLLQTIIIDFQSQTPPVDSLIIMSNPIEATSAMTILVALLGKISSDTKQRQTLTTALVTSIVQSTATSVIAAVAAGTDTNSTAVAIAIAERKVLLLSVLYNMCTDSTEKCTLLQTMLSLAAATTTTTGDGGDNDTNIIAAILLHPETTLGKLINIRRTYDDDDDTTTTTPTAVTATATSAASAEISSTLSTTIQSTVSLSTNYKPPIVSLLDMWKVSSIQRRSIYNTIINALPTTDIRKQQFLLLLVATYNDGETIDTIGQGAVKLVSIGIIRDPVSLFYQQRNILEQYAIQTILPTIDNGKLYQLLQIFVTGVVSDFESYLSTADNTTLLSSSYGLDIDTCRKYMKILSFCTLASSHVTSSSSSNKLNNNTNNNEIRYDDVKSILAVSDDSDVETWIIAAVNCGLVSAKMDQLTKTVIVEKSSFRQFTTNEWITVQQQLQQWQSNINSIITALYTTTSTTTVPSSHAQ